MVIRNPDGSIYKSTGSLGQLQPDSPTNDVFNQWDQEQIKIGGSPILYYEVIIPPSSIDPIYLESRGKLFTQHPIELYVTYDPIPSQWNQGQFGIDGPDTMVFYANYKATLDALGHLPTVGSRIFSPHLRENWEIVDRKLGDFHRFKVYRCEIHCQRFQETLTTNEGKSTQDNYPKPDFKID